MKKVFSLLLCTIILFTALVACESATPASDFTYQENDRGGITILKYNGTDDRVVIPEVIDGKNVTNIGKEAFISSDITSLVMPDTVKIISDKAFAACEKLSKIEMSNSLVSVGFGAFNGCKALSSVDLSMFTLEYIAMSAFANCASLKSVIFCDNIEWIDNSAFEGCTALKEIVLPKNLAKLGTGAFMGCVALEKVVFPVALDLSFFDAPAPFSNTPSLKEVVFENGREELVGYACIQTPVGSHIKIIIPESVKRFDTYSFLLNGAAEIEFQGDCPELIGNTKIPYIQPNSYKLSIYYDPNTEGWDTCPWQGIYTLIPIS